ncbi:MAG: hypothetical protein JOZ02_20690 [Acidobacteria bacterium]|nr:hypothetical protein [Acidobacteriota bacterium]
MAKRVAADDTQGAEQAQPVIVLGEPIVIRVKKDGKRKKMKGSSRTSRRLANFELQFSKAARRISKGCENGWDEYLNQRRKSQRNRRDGALVDYYVNMAKGASRAISEGSPALTDIAKAFNSKRLRKQIRKALRPLPMFT